MPTRRHGKTTRVYVDGIDLSGDSNSISVAWAAEMAETSGFEDHKWYRPGLDETKITHNAWLNPDANQSHPTLSGKIGTSTVFACHWGADQGDPGWGGAVSRLAAYTPASPIGGAVGLTVNYELSDYSDPIRTLFPKGGLSAAQSAWDDNGGGSNLGAVGYLEQFAILGGTPVVTVEHSVTGTASWSTLLTFTLGTAIAGERQSAAGTVRQFIRTNVSGGSATAYVGFRRL